MWRKNWPCCFPFFLCIFCILCTSMNFGTCLHLFHSAQEWGNGQGVSLSGTLFSCVWNKHVPQTSCDMYFALAIAGILAVAANLQLALFTEPSHIKGNIWSSLHNFLSHREATSQMLILHWTSSITYAVVMMQTTMSLRQGAHQFCMPPAYLACPLLSPKLAEACLAACFYPLSHKSKQMNFSEWLIVRVLRKTNIRYKGRSLAFRI